MSTEIYYFSGTGNSLFAAKELQKRIPGSSLIPIVSLLKNETIKPGTDCAGIVFPLHGMTLPVPVEYFIKKLVLKPGAYFFAVTTRGGTKTFGFKKIDKIFRKRRMSLDSSFIMEMADNDPKLQNWKLKSGEEMKKIEDKVQAKMGQIGEIIARKEKYRETDTEGITFPYGKLANFLLERLILFAMWMLLKHTNLNDYFYADPKCTGCGICEKACLSGKIAMDVKNPVWQKNVKCYFCYACLNFCPAKAVQIKSKWYMKSYTPEKDRYPHPYATVKENMAQK